MDVALTNVDFHGEKAPTFSSLFPAFCLGRGESLVQCEDTCVTRAEHTLYPEESRPRSGLWPATARS